MYNAGSRYQDDNGSHNNTSRDPNDQILTHSPFTCVNLLDLKKRYKVDKENQWDIEKSMFFVIILFNQDYENPISLNPIPLNPIPLSHIPKRSIHQNPIPLNPIPLNHIPKLHTLNPIPLYPIPLNPIPLSSIPQNPILKYLQAKKVILRDSYYGFFPGILILVGYLEWCYYGEKKTKI